MTQLIYVRENRFDCDPCNLIWSKVVHRRRGDAFSVALWTPINYSISSLDLSLTHFHVHPSMLSLHHRH